MCDNIKILYVIEKSPELISDEEIINIIHREKRNKDPITIYIHNDGIRWLLNENWHQLFRLDDQVVYYANAQDAKNYHVPFQDGVIFSNPKTLYQLINCADRVLFIH
jgi:hypothetical protein